MFMGFISFFLISFFVLFAQAGITFDDSRFDNDRLEASIFELTDLSPVSLAPFLANPSLQTLLKKIQPYAVELSATENGLSGSGVILGWNSKNQPIVLTAGHLIMYSQMDLAGVKEIHLDHPRGDERGSIADEKTHVILPDGYKNKPETTLGWYGLPIFHPQYVVDETIILRDLSLNFGYYLMTGRTVKLPAGDISNLDALYTIKESLSQGFEAPNQEPLKINSVPWESQVVVMGRAEYDSQKTEPSGAVVSQKTQKMSFSLGYVWSKKQMKRFSDQFRLDLSPKKHFVVNGEVDPQMVGSGVFNKKGELVGMIVKLIRGRKSREEGRYLGAIALRIEHILDQTQILTQQTELQERVEKLRAPSPVGNCAQLFKR